jgi:hypothetical protein
METETLKEMEDLIRRHDPTATGAWLRVGPGRNGEKYEDIRIFGDGPPPAPPKPGEPGA